TVTIDIEGDMAQLPSQVAHCIYRTVQEGLTNACKHAHAATIYVQVRAADGYVVVTVTNDNRPHQVLLPVDLGNGSFGLLGLRERAEALGGGLEAGPLAEGGWRLRLVLPYEGEE
ncbi:MAG: two-component sensor histidine kinase, partial [Chloroflexi bacterium]